MAGRDQCNKLDFRLLIALAVFKLIPDQDISCYSQSSSMSSKIIMSEPPGWPDLEQTFHHRKAYSTKET